MPTLFHQPLDVASRFVRLVMGEYGVEAELEVEKVWLRRHDFLVLNPAATVPVLQLDEAVLVGPTPLVSFLAEAREDGGAPLLPRDPADRAEVRRLIDWALLILEADVSAVLVLEKALKRQIPADQGGGAPDTQAMRIARDALGWHLSYLAHLLTGNDWLTGERLTQADLAFGAAISSLDYLGEIAWSDHPAMRDWYARLKSRPSFAPLLADRVTGVVPPSHYEDPDF
ncbi:MAG: glutathione S-transferase family protein [Devosiaceae bacterium]|nr:glutathione S-transferase family protein [Devosiaceae bacterium MH13]